MFLYRFPFNKIAPCHLRKPRVQYEIHDLKINIKVMAEPSTKPPISKYTVGLHCSHPFVCHVCNRHMLGINYSCFRFVSPSFQARVEKIETSVSGEFEEGNIITFFFHSSNLLKHNNGQVVNALSFLFVQNVLSTVFAL